MSRRWRVLGLILGVIVKMRSILNKVNKSREKMKLYCCLFPNEYEFERETLVRLWVAMEFSSLSCVENFCERYFDILLEEQYIVFSNIDTATRRNLYKFNHQGKDSMGEKKTINKEDLYIVLEDEDANGSKLGHISVVSNCINETTFKKLQNFDGELRTLLFINNDGSTLNKIPSDMFLILESLRALDLSGNDIVELPRSIGNVSQLRYLDLSFTLIESLPKSIDQLHQLQTLKLQGCTRLHELPRGIKELLCLRHLDLEVLGQLTSLPKGIGALTELCTLSAFIVDSKEGCTIRELKFLNKLRGSLCISGLENVAHVDDVQEAALQDKKYLTHLQLRWSDLILYSTEDKQLGYNIISSLNLNKGLQDLQIVCYPGLHIPAWVNFREQQNLLSITLLNCNNNDLSLPLGQLPNLKYLSIIHMNRATKIDNWFHGGGDEAYVAFPKLESLKIECMLSLETWIDVFNHDDFPFLSTLIIKQCPKLIRLPFLSHFQMLKLLEISHCTVFKCLPEGTLPVSLESLIIDDCPFLKKRCSKEGEDWHKIKHIPNIWIDLQNICSADEDDGFEDSSSKSEDICSTDEDVYEDINLSAGSINQRKEMKDQIKEEAEEQSQKMKRITKYADYVRDGHYNTPAMMHYAGDGGGGGARVGPPSVGRIIKPNPRIYTFSELKSATRNFRPELVMGEGGFGRVYKGWIDKTTLAPSKVGIGIPVAVKKCSADSTQGLKEWKTEINFLGKFSHPNLVSLIGYCWEDEELLLVYEFLNKGSLEYHLFRKNVDPPSWSTRISIAIDAARGLDFLHTSENKVMYRDFKAATILLDENFVGKLSDFGLASPPVDESHVTTQVVGTYGYAAPEYINTGHLFVRSDVYGFGVVLLEMLTGLRAYDINRPTGQTSLVDWYKPMLSEKSKLKKVIDPRMEEFPPEGINKLAELILRCLQNDPKNRPPMSEVLMILERISTIRMNTKSSKPSSSNSKGHDGKPRPHSYQPSPTRRWWWLDPKAQNE